MNWAESHEKSLDRKERRIGRMIQEGRSETKGYNRKKGLEKGIFSVLSHSDKKRHSLGKDMQNRLER